MSLARQIRALIAARNNQPGGRDDDRARLPATPCLHIGPCPDDATPDHDDENPAARPPVAPNPRAGSTSVPGPHYAAGGFVRAISAPPAPRVRRTVREFIQPLTSPQALISELCNTGRHYECTGCRCGCHPPLTNWST